MNSKEIRKILLRHLGSSFMGVYARNTLPNRVTIPAAIVCNTDKDTETGEHWVAFYIDLNRNLEYYDSYGLPPIHKEFYDFLKSQSNKWTWNSKCVQKPDSTVCGEHCIFYLIHKFRGLTLKEIQFMFGDDLRFNDCIVKNYKNQL